MNKIVINLIIKHLAMLAMSEQRLAVDSRIMGYPDTATRCRGRALGLLRAARIVRAAKRW